ncbi:MAG: hypothetical protein KJP16_07785 [Gammaproteobacteria bacterium]|nr:hypothetical protein [Gammaproteobacteria bacterium]NNL50704.1 hypothetical protein [Woeseiaceae bacterium]
MLAQIKTILRDQLGLPPWTVLVAVGCLAHVILITLLRKPIYSAWGLLAPLCLGVLLEGYEIYVQYRQVGLFAPGNDALITILGRHGLDVVYMLAGPVLVVIIGLISAK